MKVRFQPSGVIARAEAGKTVLQIATAAGVDLEGVCGGRGTCAKCRVIATGGLGPLTDPERRGLSPDDLRAGYRLACQAAITGAASVVVPDESRTSRLSILSEGTAIEVAQDPWVRRFTLRAPAPSLKEQASDLDRLARACVAAGLPPFDPALRALRELPFALRAAEGLVTLVAVDGRLVHVAPGRETRPLLGIAFDVGTTTVVGYLLDLETGRQMAVASRLNPQARYGDDVVSRIDFSMQENGLSTLRTEIVGCLNGLIDETTRNCGASPADVWAATIVGNTTMQHLLLGISPAALAQVPYVPVVEQSVLVSGAECGLDIAGEGRVFIFPNIAGWVGGDTVGVILATRLWDHDEMALAIDIGTNGEMALGSRQRLVTCSTAAGPAFEGAHLSCGMRAADGAIDRVTFGSDVLWHAIGEAKPRGICGSGLVDAVAGMVRAGVVSPSGLMQAGGPLGARIEGEGARRAFALAAATEAANGRPVVITQRDIRELQLAKGAIRSGIEILLREVGITPADVRRVYLAGAFGNYISPDSALAIGLMPAFPRAEIIPVGNAAGSGAKMALLSRTERDRAGQVAAWVEYLELSGRTDFQDVFAKSLGFGL